MVATISGPLGQRDSSGTGTAGYRVHATLAGELELAPAPSPSPTPTPTATATPTVPRHRYRPRRRRRPQRRHRQLPRQRRPPPTPTASPTPAPTSSLSTITLDAVRATAVGTVVRTTGVVTAEEGRLGTPSLLAIGDATAGLVVHMPGGAATYQRGARLEVTGKLAAPYGQLEIRPAKADIRVLGTGSLPAPMTVPPAGLSEPIEGRLVTTTGRLVAKPKKAAGGDLTLRPRTRRGVVGQGDGRRLEPDRDALRSARPTGSPGSWASGPLARARSMATGSGSVTPADVVVVAGAAASPSASPGSGSPSPGTGAIATVSIARALQDHRSCRRDRRHRHGPGDAPRCERAADRRPGRFGRRRTAAADRHCRAPGRDTDPR